MKKLQVRTAEGWAYVFCHADGQVKTTTVKAKALPSKEFWAHDDLTYFQRHFATHEFKLA